MTVEAGKSKICRASSRLSIQLKGFPQWLKGKEFTCIAGNTGDKGSSSGSGRTLKKEMTTHASILAWNIPWTEKPGGLQSMGS